MKKSIFAIILLGLTTILSAQETVERIDIVGNERVTKETILYYLTSREGDYYSRDLIQRDFRVLWATGFFSDIKIEEAEGQHGKIVRIVVEENPVIREITYKTGKKVKEDDIVNKLKENDEYLLPYSYYSPHKIQRIERTIMDLLLEKGLAAAKVEHEIKRQGNNEMEIVFKVDEGPKIKVGEVVFEGSPELPQRLLEQAFKENKRHGLVSWITGKDTFKENKLVEDLANLKMKLQEHGYMEANVGEPRFEDMEKRSIFMKKNPMKRMIIPVEAGERYSVGEINIEGNEVFKTPLLRRMVKIEPDEIYTTKSREKAIEKIRELYSNWGYIYANINPVERLDPVHKKVNVTFHIYEGEMAFLNRLEFKGNYFTKDKVIRREMLIREGDPFSFAFFKDSILRMNQLGLVEIQGEPDVTPNPEDPTKLDVMINVNELQRNNVQFTAGYSGYQGTFVAASYSTVNFLGAGEKLELSVQYGKRIRNYSFGFTEPYLFDLPINVGFNIHDMYMSYPTLFKQKSRGADFTISGRVRGYWRTSLTYSYNFLKISEPDEDEDDEYSYYNPYYYGGYGGYGGGYGGYGSYYSYYGYGSGYSYGDYNISSITPTIYRNTVDSPLTPSSGSLILASVKLAGGVLGGDIDMIKPRFELTRYIRLIKKSSLGFHIEYSFIAHLGDEDAPFWERFYLGGERSIRGYEIYTIGPRSDEGRLIGGDKSLVINTEYIIPVGGPIYAILFYDIGNAYGPDENVDFRDLYTSAGLEMRIFIPALRVPFRLIFAYNNRVIRTDDSNFNFRFAIGTTF